MINLRNIMSRLFELTE